MSSQLKEDKPSLITTDKAPRPYAASTRLGDAMQLYDGGESIKAKNDLVLKKELRDEKKQF